MGMHLRLDELRKQARMRQMYEWERTRTRNSEDNASIQTSGPALQADSLSGPDIERRTRLGDPIQPID